MVCLPVERKCRNLSDEELISIGKRVLEREARELESAAGRLGQELVDAARIIQHCRGRLVVAGMGKAGIIGRKVAATFASLGTPSFFIHAAEAAHGDLGMVRREDVGLFISHSGKTPEVVGLLPFFSRLGSPVIAITGDLNSALAKNSNVVLSAEIEREADPLNLAPTSSTTLQLAIGDALAGMVTEMRNLKREDFALFHPAGALGRKLLLRVENVMGSGERLPLVTEEASVSEALFEITSKGYGATVVVNGSGELTGVFTDGDLRRFLEKNGVTGMDRKITEAMTRNPQTIDPSRLAAEAVRIMERMEVSVLIATEGNRPVGMIHLHELLQAGVA